MTPLKLAFCLLSIVLAVVGGSMGLKCYDCTLTAEDTSCRDKPTNLVDVTEGTGDYEYCTRTAFKSTEIDMEVLNRQGTRSTTKLPLGCSEVLGPGGVFCVCNTEGCNKSNNDADYPSGASTVILGALPILCAMAVYSLLG